MTERTQNRPLSTVGLMVQKRTAPSVREIRMVQDGHLLNVTDRTVKTNGFGKKAKRTKFFPQKN